MSPSKPGISAASPPAPAAPAKISLTTPAAPTTPVKDNLITFDPSSTQVRWVNSRWQVQAGDVVIKDFGTHGNDAREALNLIRKLHLTQRGTIGRPLPIMEYWLAAGKAPVALGGGLRVTPIDLNSLRTEPIQNQWCVRDDRNILFNFGPLQEDAQQAADIIRHYAFTQVGYIGSPRPTMIYFLGNQNGFGKPTGFSHTPGAMTSMIQKEVKPASANSAVDGGEALVGKTNPGLNLALLQQAQLLAAGMHQLAPPPAGNVTQVRLDPRQLALRQERGDWKVFHGQHVVAEFGPHKDLARKALQLLQDYGCDEQYLIGQPLPSFSYFLSKGHAPLGVRYDLQGRQFHPDSLTLRQIQQSWYVCDGDRPLVFFGNRKDDAQELIQAVKRYRFDFISQIGPPDQPAMSILVRSR